MMTPSEHRRGYLVVAPTPAEPRWSVTEGVGGPAVAHSRAAPCAELAASRLLVGEPVESPDAATRRCLRLYGRAFPDIFSLYARRYLLPGAWLGGGVTDGDVTGISTLGEQRERVARRASREAMGEEMGWRGLPPLPEVDWAVSTQSTSWPTVSGAPRLPYRTPRCAAESLATMRTRDVDPEWLDDARNGVRLLLRHAAEHGDAVVSLRELAGRLAAAHGGRWSP